MLTFRDIERPTAREGEVLVRVVAAGMDRGAWHFMAGEPYLMRLLGFGFRAPSVAVPGTNFAGVVEAVGPGVGGFERGDEVYGATRGTFAEYTVAPIGKVAPKPPQVSKMNELVSAGGGTPVLGSTFSCPTERPPSQHSSRGWRRGASSSRRDACARPWPPDRAEQAALTR